MIQVNLSTPRPYIVGHYVAEHPDREAWPCGVCGRQVWLIGHWCDVREDNDLGVRCFRCGHFEPTVPAPFREMTS